MSQWRGRLEENDELERAVDVVYQYYHLALGALLLGFMLWNRVRPWQNFVVDGEVLFNGNDAWYHYRSTAYTVRNWPQTMPFDPWTYFPNGTHVGQFGTLFDQLMATVALIVGLGSPSDHTVRLVVLFAPAVLGALAGIPTYYIGRRLGGRIGGIVALAVLALSAGSILQRSVVGFSDHHIAEALFQALGVLGMMVAVTVAREERPVYEQFVDRDIDGLRRTVVWSVLAGVAVSLYLWVWPFGILLIGIVGVYLLLQLTIEFMRGESPEHTAIAGAIALGTTGVLLLIPLTEATFTVGTFSLLHPTLAFLVAGGCALMAWLARVWDQRDIDGVYYPVSIGAIIVVATIVIAVAAPNIYDLFAQNLVRIFGGVFGTTPSAQAGTIGEVQPLRRPALVLFQSHGFAAFIALLGGALIVFRNLIGTRVPPQRLLVVVWCAFLTAAALTQGRFAYYVAIPYSVLTAYVVGQALTMVFAGEDGFDPSGGESIGIEGYQVVSVVAVLLLVVAPMAAVAPATNISRYDSPGQSIEAWSDGLEWMDGNTPEEGELGDASNEMEYYGSYEKVDDYEYQAGQYGVLSWWDYGHWITTQGQRIPNANPFQQGAVNAANFLLAPNETQANDVLDDIDDENAETRYVAVDWKMAESNGNIGGKYFAPTNFYDESDVSTRDYFGRIFFRTPRGQTSSFTFQSQAYYESTVTRLYKFHGSAVGPQPVVLDWETRNQNGRAINFRPRATENNTRFQTIKTFRSMEQARNYTEQDPTSMVGGFGRFPSERVPAMEHYRLVGTSEASAKDSGSYDSGAVQTAYGLYTGRGFIEASSRSECTSDLSLGSAPNVTCVSERTDRVLHPTEPQWLKIFERVPGATVEGTAPENQTVTASVEMYNPASGENFTYYQQVDSGSDGEFNMTLPYSTTDYDEYGPENGHTNVSVRANGSYEFTTRTLDNTTVKTWSATTDLSEGAVLGVEDGPDGIELEVTDSRSLLSDARTTNETDSGN